VPPTGALPIPVAGAVALPLMIVAVAAVVPCPGAARQAAADVPTTRTTKRIFTFVFNLTSWSLGACHDNTWWTRLNLFFTSTKKRIPH
jgi:hypothetical protein